MTRLQAGWYEVPFLAGTGDFFHSQKCPDCLWGPLTLRCSGYCPLTCILVPSLRTGGTVLPLIVYHGVHKVSCTFTFMPYMSNPVINPLNPELNPICYLLALLGAHHFLHISRIMVKLLTFRLLMSCIYGAPILDVSRSHTTTQHSR